MSEEEEFRAISSLILKPDMDGYELNELVKEHKKKIIRLRKRLGLYVPEG